MSVETGHIFIISGPSGVGKDTVVKILSELDGYDDLNLAQPKSYTTRRRRKSDPEDTPYIFVSEKKFSELMFTEMIEHAQTHNHLYGMSKASFEEIMEQGHNVVKIMNREGALAFKKLYPQNTITVWLRPPSVSELKRRLKGRGTETYAEYNRRMMDNLAEMKDVSEFDYVITADDGDRAAHIILAMMRTFL